MKIKRTVLILFTLVTVMLLSSCEAVDELTGKGLWGWLGIDNPFESVTLVPSTPSGTGTEGVPPSSSVNTNTPGKPTGSLPVTKIPEYPSVDDLISELEKLDMKKNPIVIGCIEGSSLLNSYNTNTMYSIQNKVNDYYNGGMFMNIDSYEGMEAGLNGALDGGVYADLLYLPLTVAVEYAKKGLLEEIDVTRIPSIGDGYNSSLNEALKIDGKHYAVSSPYFYNYENNAVLYINTDLLKRLDVEFDIYDCIEKGEWTWETVYMICRAAQDAKEKEGLDFTIGGSLYDEAVTKALFYSSTADQLSYADSSGVCLGEFIDEFKYPYMLTGIETYMTVDEFICGDDAKEKFYRGELLLMLGNVGTVREYYQSYDSYAAVCLPKGGVNQEDYTTVIIPGQTYVFAIPKNGQYVDEVYSIMEALSYASRYCYKYEFIESLYSIYVRQSGSIPSFGINASKVTLPRILVFASKELLAEMTGRF